MDTQTLQVFSLKGMDERWIVDPQDALYIQDMTWTSNDSWRTSGGFEQLFPPAVVSIEEDARQSGAATEGDATSTITIFSDQRYAGINSIHWFAQHNGARQWLIYEEQNFIKDDNGLLVPSGTVSLKAFDGSLSKRFADTARDDAPVRVLRQLTSADTTSGQGTYKISERTESQLSMRTQSQAYGGRIYFVNGYDEPLVFDGDICERAGFGQKPPAPISMPCGFENTTTYPFAIGDFNQTMIDFDVPEEWEAFFGTDGAKKLWKGQMLKKPDSMSFYTMHQDMPYWGLGSRSDATVGAGSYRFKGTSTTPHLPQEFKNFLILRFSYFGKGQLDTRKCGFQYKVTYVNDRGQESEPSDASGVTTIENGRGGQKKALHGKGLISVDIPTGPKECVARRIYRTRNLYDSNGNMYSKGRQQSFYFLTEISDNMTTKFLDGHPDTALGPLMIAKNYGNFPPRTKYLAVFKNTMFAAGADTNELHYSAPLFPEVFPKSNIIIVGDDDGGPITGMRTTKNALIVFKTRGIYLIKGNPRSGFVAQTLNKDIGCVAPNSIAEAPGLGLIFLSDKSIFLLEGALENTGTPTSVINIGAEIPNQIELINKSASIRASAAVYQRDKEYWLSVPTLGSAKNNLCLIYHYEVGSWSVRKDFPIDCMVASRDHRGYLFMGSNDIENDNRAGIIVYTRGADSKGSRVITRDSTGLPATQEKIPINSIYETVSNDYSRVFQNFRPAHLMAYAVGYGNNGMNVNTRVNRSIDQVRTTLQSSDQQDPNETYPVYGSAKFDVDRWVAYRPTVLRFDISTTHAGPVRELSCSFAATDGNKIELIGYDLEAKVGEQRRIKPLNKALRANRR